MKDKGTKSFCYGLIEAVAFILVVVIVTALANAQTQTATRTGTIRGRVVSEQGQGVDGATVFCNHIDSGSAERTTTTDIDGHFSFDRLAPVGYRVTCYAPGYVLLRGTASLVVRIGDSLELSLVKGGVITGRVTDTNGAPVVAVQVTAYPMRDAEGRALRGYRAARSRETDDRGIYRLYGLEAGAYFVAANPVPSGGLPTPYDLEAPTYFPSSNRDGASEVVVQQGTETTGIDIRYRNTRGYTISGTLEGVRETSVDYSLFVDLFPAGAEGSIGWGLVRSLGGQRTFSVERVPDGDYEVAARGDISPEEQLMTAPRRISVRGADASGIRLLAIPLGTISGSFIVESSSTQLSVCPRQRDTSALTEVYLRAHRVEKGREFETPDRFNVKAGASVRERGEFALRDIRPGPYRLLADLPDDRWYVRTTSMPGASAERRIDLGRTPITVKPGEKISGVTMTVAEGAGSVHGKLSGEKATRGRWRVHLVPVEAEQADNALIHYEANVDRDVGFKLTHLAPGKYWMIAKPVPDDETLSWYLRRPLAWDSADRAKLRREVETAKIEIEVKVCATIKDYILPTQ